MIPAARVRAPQPLLGTVPTLTEVVDLASLVEEDAVAAVPLSLSAAAVHALPGPALVALPALPPPELAAVQGAENGTDTGDADVDACTGEAAFLGAEAQVALTQNVLRSIQKEVDAVLDQRLKDALVPILARCAESMMQALREDLASTLHEIVSGAVAGELNRLSRN